MLPLARTLDRWLEVLRFIYKLLLDGEIACRAGKLHGGVLRLCGPTAQNMRNVTDTNQVPVSRRYNFENGVET